MYHNVTSKYDNIKNILKKMTLQVCTNIVMIYLISWIEKALLSQDTHTHILVSRTL